MSIDLMPRDLVTLEMKELIEELRFSEDGSIHILLRDDVRSHCCGRMRVWFVNREGETRCWDCDSRSRFEALHRRCELLARTRILPI